MNKSKIFLLMVFLIALVVAASLVLHRAQAGREIANEWLEFSFDAPPLAATSRLEVLPLYEEASARPDMISGHGVSYLIRTDAATLLMDVGHNPDELDAAPFAQNMEKLGIAWEEIDRIVITHPHPDHLGGVDAWRKRTVSFGNIPGGIGDRLIFVPSKTTYKNAIHATIPTLPSPDVATTGVISYLEVWPISLFTPKGGEQALVIHVAEEGLVLITGCGHPTLERLVERAESLYGLTVVGVVGGLHYEGSTAADVQPAIQYLQSRQPGLVALSPHDSSPEALAAFASAFPEAYRSLAVGEWIQFP